MTRPWKPRVKKYTWELVGWGEKRRLPKHERWFVEREWWGKTVTRRFSCWEYAMAYANHLPLIVDIEESDK